MDGRPLDVLEATVGDEVTVHLKDGQTYRGRLAGFDQHMNLVLEAADAETTDSEATDSEAADSEAADSEAADAESTDVERVEPEPVEDTTIIRGDNVVSIHP